MKKLSRLLSKIKKSFCYHYFPTEKEKILKIFLAEKGQQKLFEHELDENSLVIDAGGYEGDFTAEIAARYNCVIKVWEPVPEYAEIIKKRFEKNKKIEVIRAALGNCNRIENISIQGESSSIYSAKTNEQTIPIQIFDIVEWFNRNSILSVSLMSINIEGGEYPLLDRLIESGYIRRIERLQIQFHNMYQKDAEERMEKIQKELSKTHELTYQYRFVWENWKRKKK
jgi:FkbM family methyltransferase